MFNDWFLYIYQRMTYYGTQNLNSVIYGKYFLFSTIQELTKPKTSLTAETTTEKISMSNSLCAWNYDKNVNHRIGG